MSQREIASDYANQIIQILPDVVLILGQDDRVLFANYAAENFFNMSVNTLTSTNLQNLIPHDNPLLSILQKVRRTQQTISEFAIPLVSPKIGNHTVTAKALPMTDAPDKVLLTLVEQKMTARANEYFNHKGSGRSVAALGAMLAHEVKNPLSGIRGAAQLLEGIVGPEDRNLARLVVDETDRIVKILDHMDNFFDGTTIPQREPVNIHSVINHVMAIAVNGFGKKVNFKKNFDPSLPPVYGQKDQLIQIFLNLIKNACEAADTHKPKVFLSTSFRHGVKFTIPGLTMRHYLPLMVSVADNGAGIKDDILPFLFDPFISSKPNGKGLGLALVSKLVDDHGGIIDLDSRKDLTCFNVFLPIYKDEFPSNKHDSDNSL